MQSNLITDTLAKLSARFRNENDLSDLIWTLCEVSVPFKQFFLSFFFADLPKETIGIQLQREFTRGNSRPDFFFEFAGKEYLIEVKIYDGNDHFGQYKIDFPKANRSWIANYAKAPHPDFTIKTWRDFHAYLEQSQPGMDPETLALVQGFCEYLRSVCSIIKFKKMDLSNLQSLYHFNHMINKIIERPHDDIETKLYTSAKSFFDTGSGKFFSLQARNKPDMYYPWFGVDYGSGIVCICIGFSKGWCQKIHSGIKESKDFTGGNLFMEIYPSDNNYWFEMKKEEFEKFNNLPTPESQEQHLTAFFDEVMEAVKRYL